MSQPQRNERKDIYDQKTYQRSWSPLNLYQRPSTTHQPPHHSSSHQDWSKLETEKKKDHHPVSSKWTSNINSKRKMRTRTYYISTAQPQYTPSYPYQTPGTHDNTPQAPPDLWTHQDDATPSRNYQNQSPRPTSSLDHGSQQAWGSDRMHAASHRGNRARRGRCRGGRRGRRLLCSWWRPVEGQSQVRLMYVARYAAAAAVAVAEIVAGCRRSAPRLP